MEARENSIDFSDYFLYKYFFLISICAEWRQLYI